MQNILGVPIVVEQDGLVAVVVASLPAITVKGTISHVHGVRIAESYKRQILLTLVAVDISD